MFQANCVGRLGDPLGGTIDKPLRHGSRQYPHQLLQGPAGDGRYRKEKGRRMERAGRAT